MEKSNPKGQKPIRIPCMAVSPYLSIAVLATVVKPSRPVPLRIDLQTITDKKLWPCGKRSDGFPLTRSKFVAWFTYAASFAAATVTVPE